MRSFVLWLLAGLFWTCQAQALSISGMSGKFDIRGPVQTQEFQGGNLILQVGPERIIIGDWPLDLPPRQLVGAEVSLRRYHNPQGMSWRLAVNKGEALLLKMGIYSKLTRDGQLPIGVNGLKLPSRLGDTPGIYLLDQAKKRLIEVDQAGEMNLSGGKYIFYLGRFMQIKPPFEHEEAHNRIDWLILLKSDP